MVGRALEQTATARLVQGEHMTRTRHERDLGDPAKMRWTAHHHRRLGVANEVFDFGALVGGIEWQEDKPRTQRGEVQDERLDRFLHLHGNAGTGRQLQRGQQVGHHGRGLVQVTPRVAQHRPRPTHGFNGTGILIGWKRRAQRGKKVVVAHENRCQNWGGRLARKAEMPSMCSALSAYR
ncbi:hypothetical protein FQZ97_915550 [compost metagenome]